jgi:small subunit ribosomal protein S16
MVVIRLARGGAKKRPFYHVVAADKRRARDSKYIERLGFYNPIATGKEVGLQLEREKIANWLAKGAKMSDKVKVLLQDWDKKSAA